MEWRGCGRCVRSLEGRLISRPLGGYQQASLSLLAKHQLLACITFCEQPCQDLKSNQDSGGCSTPSRA